MWWNMYILKYWWALCGAPFPINTNNSVPILMHVRDQTLVTTMIIYGSAVVESHDLQDFGCQMGMPLMAKEAKDNASAHIQGFHRWSESVQWLWSYSFRLQIWPVRPMAMLLHICMPKLIHGTWNRNSWMALTGQWQSHCKCTSQDGTTECTELQCLQWEWMDRWKDGWTEDQLETVLLSH